jgi:hypothetical protein
VQCPRDNHSPATWGAMPVAGKYLNADTPYEPEPKNPLASGLRVSDGRVPPFHTNLISGCALFPEG